MFISIMIFICTSIFSVIAKETTKYGDYFKSSYIVSCIGIILGFILWLFV